MSVSPPTATRVSQTFASLRSYNYRLYWFGQLISQAGTWMQVVAQAWLVLQLTHSPFALGTVSALQFLPVLCVTLFAGVIVDRLPKHRLLLATQSVALAQAVALAVLTASGRIQLWEVYVLAALLGLVSAFDQPTRQSFVMELVGRENIVNAVALNSAQFNAARLIGPAIGGVLIASFGVAICFFVNAVSFLAVLASLLLLRAAEFRSVPSKRTGKRVLTEIGEGLRFLRSAPDLMVVVIVVAGIGCFGYNFNTVIPLLAQYSLHVGASGFGLLVTSVGIGSLVAALAVATRGKASQRVFLTGAIGFGLSYLAVAFVPWFGAAMGLLAVLGFASLTFSSAANSTLQLGSPDHLRGRVMSVFTLLVMGSTPIGALFTGWLAETAGIQVTIAVEAGICLLFIAAALLYRSRRRTTARIDPASEGLTAAA
ncbi:MAG TPA: MFS transporter [Chloroflexota bacterium]|nr:MFS transporter [Chloroflexota bacterium]